MRTKILLTAAAALVAGIASSNAQVYSANVVGYVNVTAPAGQYVMVANPLTTGNDVLTNVIQGAPAASVVQVWTGTTFVGYTYSALTKHWKNGATIGDATPLPPGTGFFLTSPSTFTNTFVGSVVANTGGGTATNALSTGYSPVGSLIPYSDFVTNPATINLQVGSASGLQLWNQTAQQYQPAFTYSGLAHTWKQGSTVTNPFVGPAQGFFISPSTATNWVETLQ